MKESSLILYRDKIIDYKIGSFTEVDFNFNKVWLIRKEKNYMDLGLQLFHVHPEECLFYSEKDRQLLKGWTLALGHTFPFYIITFKNSIPYNIEHDTICYYYNKELDEIKEDLIMTVPIFVLQKLKYLSYKEY